MKELILHDRHFEVFIKGIEEPMELSWEDWAKLWIALAHKDCPPFVNIKWGYYNRFEIARVIPHEENISKERAEALAEYKRILSLKK